MGIRKDYKPRRFSPRREAAEQARGESPQAAENEAAVIPQRAKEILLQLDWSRFRVDDWGFILSTYIPEGGTRSWCPLQVLVGKQLGFYPEVAKLFASAHEGERNFAAGRRKSLVRNLVKSMEGFPDNRIQRELRLFMLEQIWSADGANT